MSPVQAATPKRGWSVRTVLERALSQGHILALLILIALFVVYANSATNVFTPLRMANLLTNGAPLVVAATGLTLVILVGGFDLSLGGIVVLANVLLATRTGVTFESGLLATFIVLGAGLAVGALNGFLVAYLRVQSIAATLGTFIMCTGLALVILPTPGGSVPSFVSPGLSSSIGGVFPVSLIVILLCVVAWVAVKRTRFGVHIYAVGNDERAAMQSGISVAWVKFRVYVAAGLMYSVAGIMLSAQTASGDPNASALFMVLSFAAVAIGGVRFGGGQGTALGSIFGAGILTVLQKTLFAVGVSTFYTGIFQGVVLIVAVLVGQLSVGIASRAEESLGSQDGHGTSAKTANAESQTGE